MSSNVLGITITSQLGDEDGFGSYQSPIDDMTRSEMIETLLGPIFEMDVYADNTDKGWTHYVTIPDGHTIVSANLRIGVVESGDHGGWRIDRASIVLDPDLPSGAGIGPSVMLMQQPGYIRPAPMTSIEFNIDLANVIFNPGWGDMINPTFTGSVIDSLYDGEFNIWGLSDCGVDYSILTIETIPEPCRTASFQGLGHIDGRPIYSIANAVSDDGSVVVGQSGQWTGPGSSIEAFRWTQSEGMVGLGDFPGGNFISMAYCVSGDGAAIGGRGQSITATNDNPREGARWTDTGGMVGTGYTTDQTVVTGSSYDGSVMVGWDYDDNYKFRAFRWTNFSGGVTFEVQDAAAYAVSDNGNIVAGDRHPQSASLQAYRWTQTTGIVELGDLIGGGVKSHTNNISKDGSHIVGWGESESGTEAFRWTESEGMVGLGDLPGGDFYSIAWDVSSDGSIIVGEGSTALGNEAFIWDAVNGMRNLKEVLVNIYGLDLTDWTLTSARGISADGLTIVGGGINPDGNTEAWIATISESTCSSPPDANANGPYTVFVGDPLTLDGSGSTDADDDIVSYIWDLDDDEIYETDAGAEAIFTVDYAYLESISLLIDHTYTIHLKVTDSEEQSDIVETTLIILPKPPVEVFVDIKPGGCPNPLNTKSSGVLPVAILGSADLDVTTIDPTSILLSGVQPIRSSLEDVGTPLVDANDCDCTKLGPDGWTDLTLKFATQQIVETIGEVEHGDILELKLTGILYDPAPYERPIEGKDCIVIKGKHKPLNIVDVNGDGVVDTKDFAIFSENWLESSIIE